MLNIALYIFSGLLSVPIILLILRLMWPKVISYPWDETTVEGEAGETVILAGSYNPPHYGHLAMLQYLAKKYKKVYAVIGFNPDKKYLVSPEQRANLLRKMIGLTPGTNEIEVVVVDGYIWRFARRQGATKFFRGIRTWEKDGKDEMALQVLNTWGPILYGPLFWPIPTVYLEGKPEYNHISSTLIRDLCKQRNEENKNKNDWSSNNGTLSELVPSQVTAEVAELYNVKPE